MSSLKKNYLFILLEILLILLGEALRERGQHHIEQTECIERIKQIDIN